MFNKARSSSFYTAAGWPHMATKHLRASVKAMQPNATTSSGWILVPPTSGVHASEGGMAPPVRYAAAASA